MDQISMSSVNLNDAEAGFTGTACGGGKSRDDAVNSVDGERSGHRIAIGERQCARGDDIIPAAITFGNGSVACPRRVSAGLATGMRQLHPSDAALIVNKPHDSSQWLNVIIPPDAQILRTNPALGNNGSRFGKDQGSSAHRAAAEVHEMPVARVSVRAGVLTHGRNEYAIRKCNIPNRERIKQVSHRCRLPFSIHEALTAIFGVSTHRTETAIWTSTLPLMAFE